MTVAEAKRRKRARRAVRAWNKRKGPKYELPGFAGRIARKGWWREVLRDIRQREERGEVYFLDPAFIAAQEVKP